MVSELMHIKEISWNSRKINLKATVIEKTSEKTVTVKKDNSQHRVASFLLRDKTGEISLNIWDEDIEKIPVGKDINIYNGYANQFGGVTQLNIGKFGSWDANGSKKPEALASSSAKIESPKKEAPKTTETFVPANKHEQNVDTNASAIQEISQLQNGMKNVSLRASITLVYPYRTVTYSGKSHSILELLLQDESGSNITLVLWDTDTKYKEGQILYVTGGYVKTFKNILQLNLSKNGAVSIEAQEQESYSEI